MMKFIFLTLFLFVSNFFQVELPYGYIDGFNAVLQKSKNEYIGLRSDMDSRPRICTLKVDYDNITLIDENDFTRNNWDDDTYSILVINKNLIFYGFLFQTSVENNGKINDISWGGHVLNHISFQNQVFSNDLLVICTWEYNNLLHEYYSRYDFELHLVKPPYIEISKSLIIETLSKDQYLELIGLKDYFAFIKIDESKEEIGSGNITYKFLDLDLNLIDTMTYKYQNYSDIRFLPLTNNGKVNEFLVCILKEEDKSENLSTYKCDVFKYENGNLDNIQSIEIPIFAETYSLETYFFDGNKIILYFYSIYSSIYDSNNDYINILKYENHVLSYYKNLKNFPLPKIVYYRRYRYHFVDFAMTEQGIGLIFEKDFYYLYSICVPKTITLYSNELLDFPIEEIIFPGINPLQFSFDEISEPITIYKNSNEIKIGEIFDNLENFTYFLKIDKVFKEIKLRIKNHEFDFICNINIEVYINTNISTYKDTQKCLKNNEYDEINNIVYSNLYDYFTIKQERVISIELEFEKEPKGNELRFYFDDNIQDYFDDRSSLLCKKNSTKIICDKIPISVLPKLKRIHLYSYLSCYNLIDVGWFELNDKNIFNIYSLIYEDFDEISKIYEPSRNISEYNPAMINYYYWFSCLSYCDDEKIERRECCNNILDKWELVFHKEYDYEEGILKMIIEKLYEIVEDWIKKRKKNPSTHDSNTPNTDNSRTDTPGNSRTDTPDNSRTDTPGNSRTDTPHNSRTDTPGNSRTDTPHNSRTDTPGNSRTDTPDNSRTDTPDNSRTDIPNVKLFNITELGGFANEFTDKFEIDPIENLQKIILDLYNSQNNTLNGQKAILPSYIKLNGKSWIPTIDIKELVLRFTKIVYLYNIVILKNDDYKKIVVTFPGTSTYLQILDELYDEEMVKLPITDGDQRYFVMSNYYKLFSRIEDDLFNALEPLANNPEYQVIFTGHSIGGAMATLASFYYIKKYNFKSPNILLTFGQPKVGDENFAKEITKIMDGQIYRIARPLDIATLFPLSDIDYLYKAKEIVSMALKAVKFVMKIKNGDVIGVWKDTFDFIKNIDEITENIQSVRQHLVFTHMGGLYMIDDDTSTVYHCDDFYNEKREHFICKNHLLQITWTIGYDMITYFYQNRNYLSLGQDIMGGCQKAKKLALLHAVHKVDWEGIFLERRLEIINYNNNININNNKGIRKLNNIEITQTLKLFEEINLEKNKFEFCFKYESTDILKSENLFLIFNPKNNYLFGEICLTQNITWLINEEFQNINCYFTQTLNPFSLKITLKKEIINEKELYIYIKGKFSGTLELYDLTQNKTLNISSSYIIPYISDFLVDNSLNFVISKIEEDTYINLIIYDNISNENLTNINISSIFEIYKDNNIIDYENNSDIILEKNSEYYFKYYPGLYKLIINFVPIYSNKFLEKVFYIVDEQNIRISYNIESINSNQSFGLFFDFDEIINIRGYFSTNINENTNNSNIYTLNIYNKYFNLTKNMDRYKYFNLDLKIESQFVSELIIYDIQEVIIINKAYSIYEINKNKNYIFLLDEILKKNYSKVESYIVISINNDNNFIKLISLNDEIITSKNYLISRLDKIKGIFVYANEDDTFKIKLISEDLSKYLNEENPSNNIFSFIDDKKYSIDFIHAKEDINVYYNPLSTGLKIFEINEGINFELDDIINNKNNYSLLFNMKSLKEKKTYMIYKELSNQFFYEKYIDNLIIDLNCRLYQSKIFYLFLDFEYKFSYNAKIKKILMKVLNKDKDKNEDLFFYCNNEIKEIKNKVQILNVEKCNGTFVMLGNNSLIYFYLPHTAMDSYNIIENKDNFELKDIYHFFFIPKKNKFNSINILLTIENEDPDDDPAFLYYYIDYGIIPFSRNIKKNQIIFKQEANLVIPNYANNSIDNETYFIYFRFNTTLSKLNAKIIYENIIYLDDQTYIILEPGINIIKFRRNIDHYVNITKFNKNENRKANYTIYKDKNIIEQNIINDTNNIIYIEEPIYRENIKLKIESDDEILLRVSPEYFDDFSVISYDTNLDIKQIENILRIKFNTTNYGSRLEYQIALIEKEDNINPLLIHKKFYENNLIYKNIIYSKGKETIERNISLINDINNFSYDKNYTVIGYGKDIYGDNANYFYMDPVILFVSDPNKANMTKENNTVINVTNVTNVSNTFEIQNSDSDIIEPTTKETVESTKNEIIESTAKAIVEQISSTTKIITESTATNDESKSITSTSNVEPKTDKIIIEQSIIPITSIEETDIVDTVEDSTPLIDINKRSDDDNKANTLAIVFSAIGGVVILGGILGLTIYFKKKATTNLINSNKEPGSSVSNIKF